MAKRSGGVPLVVSLDGRSGTTLQRQLYEGLRAAILGGRLHSGQRLPSTRSLAKDLAVSRNTVAGVFGQLVAEGYAEARVGSEPSWLVPFPKTSPGSRRLLTSSAVMAWRTAA